MKNGKLRMENGKCGGCGMNGKEIASKIAGLIGSNVSPSQVSHARTYFGPCSDDDLVAKFVAYYKQYGKKPRVPNGLRKADVNTNSNPLASESRLERSVRRIRDKLVAIRSLADSALTITEPLDDGSFLNLCATYNGLSASIAAIREFCGPSIAEGK